MTINFETRILSSLAKVFADSEIMDAPLHRGSVLLGEIYSFQVAYRTIELTKHLKIQVMSELSPFIVSRVVGLVPSELPVYHDHDDDILRSTPGLYPDPLYPIDSADGVKGLPNQWRSLWVTVDLQNGEPKPGVYPIEVVFETEQGEVLARDTFQLEVIGVKLPSQKLIYTNWFHVDCLATYYGIEVWSERHWWIIDSYIQRAVKYGMNMILTPIFTPPLDTAIGGERPTVQLVDVFRTGDKYEFGFQKLERWIHLCKMRGIQYFEFSHLFTQWGAKHAPKIIAHTDGCDEQIFGWHTDATGHEYRTFLSQFLPALLEFIQLNGLEHSSFFHVSDEPTLGVLEDYRRARQGVAEYLQDYPMIDALSDYEFYAHGLVKNPIPATNHAAPFLENEVPGLWTYYCCGQYKDVANRLFSMPSYRNRILGLQLYKFNFVGFLHWGFNFWYSQYSVREINPFQVTDAGCAFPSGDPFVVYPGDGGAPIDSLRLLVFHEALQDMRALQLLEQRFGRDAVLEMLEEGLEEPISLGSYPRNAEWILNARERINQKIKSSL